MELEAISGAATVALASTIVFMLVAKTWTVVTRSIAKTPNFSDRMLHEAAQRFRDELEHLVRSQSIYLSSALAFVLLFLAAYTLRASELFVNYPAWQLYLQLTFLGLTALYAGFRLLRNTLASRQLRFVRDASIAIGHQLRQLCVSTSRVYHDVPTKAGPIDHVVIGQSGLYAINVVARRARKDASVRIEGNELHFSDSEETCSVVDIIAKSRRLEKELRQLIGHDIRVRSVIAAPGWNIGEQNGNNLLVNERTIGVISGWKDAADHLMNEDVDAMQDELTARCRAV